MVLGFCLCACLRAFDKSPIHYRRMPKAARRITAKPTTESASPNRLVKYVVGLLTFALSQQGIGFRHGKVYT